MNTSTKSSIGWLFLNAVLLCGESYIVMLLVGSWRFYGVTIYAISVILAIIIATLTSRRYLSGRNKPSAKHVIIFSLISGLITIGVYMAIGYALMAFGGKGNGLGGAALIMCSWIASPAVVIVSLIAATISLHLVKSKKSENKWM